MSRTNIRGAFKQLKTFFQRHRRAAWSSFLHLKILLGCKHVTSFLLPKDWAMRDSQSTYKRRRKEVHSFGTKWERSCMKKKYCKSAKRYPQLGSLKIG
jgi:hypothetical protein